MVCRCRDGTYGTHCCSQGSRGPRSTSPRGPNYKTLAETGSALTGRRISRAGQTVINYGIAQITASKFSNPKPSGKIWMNMTKGEAKTHAPGIPKKDYKKYDWQPKGNTLRGSIRDSRIAQRGRLVDNRYGEWEEHKRRRPVKGIYSQTTESDVSRHRRSQRRRGLVKVGTGTGMRLLGEGMMVVQLGQYASWLIDDPSDATVHRIAKDFTLYDNVREFVIDEWMDRLQPDPTISS